MHSRLSAGLRVGPTGYFPDRRRVCVPPKERKDLSMPHLNLRGRIVGAAALVFVLAIASGLAYVVYSNQQHDLQNADRLLDSVADTEARTIELVIKEHQTEANAMADELATMVKDPAIGHDFYKDLFVWLLLL